MYGGVTEGPGLWVDGVVVAGVRDLVDSTVFSADGVLAEADGTVGQSLAVVLPVRVAPPAVVDWVPCSA